MDYDCAKQSNEEWRLLATVLSCFASENHGEGYGSCRAQIQLRYEERS